MKKSVLRALILQKKSYLCIGLDSDIEKIPPHLHKEKDPIFAFNRRIIDATHHLAVAYKINTAFYEAMGVKGWKSLQKTWEYLPGDCLSIADAKRGDIGNTSDLYARAFFEKKSSGLSFDAITVAPYMGKDSVKPFLQYPNKWAILLALTSNKSSADFQTLSLSSNQLLFEKVLEESQKWGNDEQIMYVIGATQAEHLKKIREIVPNHFLLIPGVGAQGGSLEEVSTYGMNDDIGLLINASRSIIYASNGTDFAKKAEKEAQKIQIEMEKLLAKKFLPSQI